MRSPLRLGLIGFGRLAEAYYCPALRVAAASARLGVVEPAERARRDAERAWPGVTFHASAAALIEAMVPHGMIVASPPSTHLAAWKAARADDVPVLMEKPFPFRTDLDALATVDARHAKTIVNFNRRHWIEYQRVRRWIEAGTLGAMKRIDLSLLVELGAWASVSQHRLETGEGGALWDLGSQAVDLAIWLAGRLPESIEAEQSGAGTTAQRVTLQLGFPDRLVAKLEVGYVAKGRESLTISGALAEAHLANPNMRAALNRERKPLQALAADWIAIGGRAARRQNSMMRATIGSALTSFLLAVEGKGPYAPSLSHGVAVARCLMAAEQSMALGRRVEIEVADAAERRPLFLVN